MTIERIGKDGFIATGAHVRLVQMRAQLGMMRMEAIGLRHSSGRSVTAAVKRQHGLRGNRQSVIAQFEKLIKEWKP